MTTSKLNCRTAAEWMIVGIASMVWILEILAWTIGMGKFPGSYLPSWVSAVSFSGMVMAPVAALLVGLMILVSTLERFNLRLALIVLFGLSPLLIVAARVILR